MDFGGWSSSVAMPPTAKQVRRPSDWNFISGFLFLKLHVVWLTQVSDSRASESGKNSWKSTHVECKKFFEFFDCSAKLCMIHDVVNQLWLLLSSSCSPSAPSCAQISLAFVQAEKMRESRWMNGTCCKGENLRHSVSERRAQSKEQRTGVNGEPKRAMSEDIELKSSDLQSHQCSVISHIFFAWLRFHLLHPPFAFDLIPPRSVHNARIPSIQIGQCSAARNWTGFSVRQQRGEEIPFSFRVRFWRKNSNSRRRGEAKKCCLNSLMNGRRRDWKKKEKNSTMIWLELEREMRGLLDTFFLFFFCGLEMSSELIWKNVQLVGKSKNFRVHLESRCERETWDVWWEEQEVEVEGANKNLVSQ